MGVSKRVLHPTAGTVIGNKQQAGRMQSAGNASPCLDY